MAGLDRLLGDQEFEVPRISESRHVKLSALCIGRLYSQKIFLVLISARGRVNPRDGRKDEVNEKVH